MTMHVISCKIDEDTFKRLEEMRRKVNTSKSDFLRTIIQKAFENYENGRLAEVNDEDSKAEIAESFTSVKPVPAIEVKEPEHFIIKSPKDIEEVKDSESKLVEPEKVEAYEPDFDEDLEDSEIARYECGNCGYKFGDLPTLLYIARRS
ncbi:hypothetical protein Arcve_1729 [Archaeoglobus veneficus SNP6]|uniref:Uncharacterized protein n=1 Tax=Archaeoglobus veneficus (strain DSM 11195 / SNP6) TaxID=693661 RepID=F2KQJ5_ARCVS|nr:hypothetical protein Arcve_1729 [Archaeoglobus veneficus SNP6]